MQEIQQREGYLSHCCGIWRSAAGAQASSLRNLSLGLAQLHEPPHADVGVCVWHALRVHDRYRYYVGISDFQRTQTPAMDSRNHIADHLFRLGNDHHHIRVLPDFGVDLLGEGVEDSGYDVGDSDADYRPEALAWIGVGNCTLLCILRRKRRNIHDC